MRKFLLLISLLCCLTSIAQNHGARQTFWGLLRPPAAGPPCPNPPCLTNLSFTDIPSGTDFKRPGGNEQWNFQSGGQIASFVTGPPRVDYDPTSAYRRYFWSDLEDNTQGVYKFNGKLRTNMTTAANNGRLFSFGVGTLYPGPDLGGFNDIYTYDGNFSVYPQYVHNGMQAQAQPDFNDGEVWIPNYNSTVYLGRLQALWTALKGWFDTAFIRPTTGPRAGQTIPALNMIAYIDIRGYGSYGEWHHCCLGNGYDVISNWPAGRFGTVNTMKQIVDIHVNTFNNTPFVAIINTMDGGWFPTSPSPGFNNTKIPAEVGIYILTKFNNAGRVGLRRDQVGNDEQYYHMILEGNLMTFGGVRADTAIMNTYRYAYWVGEPQGGPPNSCPNINMGCSPGQVRLYHMYSFGNGNYGGTGGVPTGQGLDSVRTAFRIAGARIKMNTGTMTTTLQQNAAFNVTISWQNINFATEHRAWTTVYELRNGANNTIWTSSIGFSVKAFAGGTSSTSNNNFTLPLSVPVGTYRLVVRIVDPTGYLDPYPLGTNGREADGAYQIRSGIQVVAGS